MSTKDKYYLRDREKRIEGAVYRSKESNANSRDEDAPLTGKGKWERMRLGLFLMKNRSIPGVGHCTEDIALWAGCTHQAITQIERRALDKVREYLKHCPRLRAEFLEIIQRSEREPAKPKAIKRS